MKGLLSLVRLLKAKSREARIVASYRAAYEGKPLNEDERRMLDAAAALTGEAL
jgi:hypothetical protein